MFVFDLCRIWWCSIILAWWSPKIWTKICNNRLFCFFKEVFSTWHAKSTKNQAILKSTCQNHDSENLHMKNLIFSLGSALTQAKGHFFTIFQGGVNFGSPWLGNRSSYRPLVGLIGFGIENTFSMRCFAISKISISALVVPHKLKMSYSYTLNGFWRGC